MSSQLSGSILMTNQFNPAFPVGKHSSSDNNKTPNDRTKNVILALCLSIIPALGIGVTSYHLTSQFIIQKIAQSHSSETSSSSALQEQMPLNWLLASGLTALLVSAIALLAHRLTQPSTKLPYSKKALLFADIASCSQPINLDYLYNQAVEGAREILGTDRVIIYTLGPNWNGTIIAESVAAGVVPLLGNQIENSCLRDSQGGLYQKGRFYVINDIYQADLSDCYIKLFEQYQVKSTIVVPLFQDEQVLGLIMAQQCDQGRIWQLNDIDFFLHLATLINLKLSCLNVRESMIKNEPGHSVTQMALGIRQSLDPEEVFDTEELAEPASLDLEQITLRQIWKTEAKRLQILADFTCVIRQSLNSQDIFSTSVAEIRQTLETELVLIYRFSADGKSGEITSQAIAPDCTPAQREQIHQLLQSENFRGYETGNISFQKIDQDSLTPVHSQLLEQMEIQASIVVPIISQEKLVGLLSAHRCSSCRDWHSSEFYFLKQLATQIGWALDQTHLIEQLNQISTQQQQQHQQLQDQFLNLLDDVEEVVKGNLTVRVDVTEGAIGTIADFFNAVIESLRQIITQVKQTTTQVNKSLRENSGAARQLAEIAEKQTQETSRTFDSVEKMTRSIQEVANSANHAAAVAHTTLEIAQVGKDAMDCTVQKIWKLRETVAETTHQVKRLGESSREISKVVGLINQIAVQANLLAINAGIEAARAGEEGQGFAGVAKEVGCLAARSVAAMTEIEQIVKKIQFETRQAMEAMELGTNQVIEGTCLVEDTQQSLNHILEVSRKIDHLVASISLVTVSQAQTSQWVTDLMKEMVIVSEETSQCSQQVSSSLQETVEVAQQLQASVEVFKVDQSESDRCC